jgi:hypothetical protein
MILDLIKHSAPSMQVVLIAALLKTKKAKRIELFLTEALSQSKAISTSVNLRIIPSQ